MDNTRARTIGHQPILLHNLPVPIAEGGGRDAIRKCAAIFMDKFALGREQNRPQPNPQFPDG